VGLAGQAVVARVGAVGVYATAAVLDVHRRTRAERLTRAGLTLAGSWLVAPLAFLIPPYLESGLIALVVGAWLARRAWRGEWVAEQMSGTCPRCTAALTLRSETVLYLPHTIHCPACAAECWIELEPAPDIDTTTRQAAIDQLLPRPRGELGGRPPLTWSPAASNWRDPGRIPPD
jgi:hypothetical protein